MRFFSLIFLIPHYLYIHDSIPPSLSDFLSRHHPSLWGSRLEDHIGLTESTPPPPPAHQHCTLHLIRLPGDPVRVDLTLPSSAWHTMPSWHCFGSSAYETSNDWHRMRKQHLHCGKAAWVMNPELWGFLPVEVCYQDSSCTLGDVCWGCIIVFSSPLIYGLLIC